MIPKFAPVVLVTEQIGQLVEGLLCAPTEQRPGFVEPVHRGALQRAQYGELTVQVVQFVKSLGELNKVCHGVGAYARFLVLQDLLK